MVKYTSEKYGITPPGNRIKYTPEICGDYPLLSPTLEHRIFYCERYGMGQNLYRVLPGNLQAMAIFFYLSAGGVGIFISLVYLSKGVNSSYLIQRCMNILLVNV